MANEELAKRKAALKAEDPKAMWRVVTFFSMAEAVEFANFEPAQKGGEFGATSNPGGGVVGFYFF